MPKGMGYGNKGMKHAGKKASGGPKVKNMLTSKKMAKGPSECCPSHKGYA